MKKTRKPFIGTVVLLDISGIGPNSAQILFTLKSPVESKSFVVNAYPAHEPAVFAAYSSLLSMAYVNNDSVGVRYESFPGETDRVAGMSIKK